MRSDLKGFPSAGASYEPNRGSVVANQAAIVNVAPPYIEMPRSMRYSTSLFFMLLRWLGLDDGP
jgi:hypothetical protein